MSGLGRGLVITVAVLVGAYIGVGVECTSASSGDCIPVLGYSIGAVVAGVVAARLTRPRRPPTYADPDLEQQIRERRRRWTGDDD